MSKNDCTRPGSDVWVSASFSRTLALAGFSSFDTTVRFGKLEGPWELAFIVRNLTNKLYMVSGYDDGATFGTPGDILAYMNRPRQFLLQLTVRPEL